jgi:hypothetical protein
MLKPFTFRGTDYPQQGLILSNTLRTHASLVVEALRCFDVGTVNTNNVALAQVLAEMGRLDEHSPYFLGVKGGPLSPLTQKKVERLLFLLEFHKDLPPVEMYQLYARTSLPDWPHFIINYGGWNARK